MAVSTSNWLTNQDGARLALVFAIEGHPTLYTTEGDTAAILTAWAATTFASCKAGLEVPSSLSQAIEPMHPQIEPGMLSVDLIDGDDTIAPALFRTAGGTRTEITADVDNNDTTINVVARAGLTSPVYLNRTTYTFSGSSASTITGCAPTYTLATTQGSTAFAHYAQISVDTGYRPLVSTVPDTWHGRLCELWLHHYDQGAWSTKANAVRLFAGRIRKVKEGRGGAGGVRISISAESVLSDLRTVIPASMMNAHLAPGLYLETWMVQTLTSEFVSGLADNDPIGTLTGTGANLTQSGLASKLQAMWNAARAGLTLDYDWSLSLSTSADGSRRYRIRVEVASGTTPSEFSLSMHRALWVLLGFDPGSDTVIESSTGTSYVLYRRNLEWGPSRFELVAENEPADYVVALKQQGAHLSLADVKGSYNTQPTPLPDVGVPMLDATGFLRIGDSTVVAVKRNSSTNYSILANVSGTLKVLGLDSENLGEFLVFTSTNTTWTVPVRQVWLDVDSTRTILYRALLSTGTSGYNHTTHDVYPVGMGCAIPYSLIDVQSLERLSDYPAVSLYERPEAFVDQLERVLGAAQCFLVFKNGKITAVQPRLDGSSIATSYTLDNSNTYRPNDYADVDVGTEGIFNRCELKWGRTLRGEYVKPPISVEDIASMARFGRRKTLTLEAPFTTRPGDDDALLTEFSMAAANALGFFSREVMTYTRSYNYKLIEMTPGDSVLVTDPFVTNPTTGSRGITNQPGWVISTDFNLATGEGTVTVLMLPEIAPDKLAAWAPAAFVDKSATNGGYVVVDGSTRYLQCLAHQFSDSTEAVDVGAFSDSDVCNVREFSPSNTASPQEIDVTVSTVDTTNSRLYLSATIASWNSSVSYIVEYARYSSVQTSQKTESFLADDADGLVVDTTAAYRLGMPSAPLGSPSIDYTTLAPTVPTSTIAADGRPHTVADWYFFWIACNNFLSYGTRAPLLSQTYSASQENSATGTTYTLVLGPMPLPLYGRERDILFRAYGRHSTNTTNGWLRFVLSPEPAVGSSMTAISWPAGSTSVEFNTQQTSDVWLAEQALSPVGFAREDATGTMVTWLTVEAKGGTAGQTMYLGGVSAWEDSL